MTSKDNHHYNRHLKDLARDLRNESTRAEVRLWSVVLRARKTGYQCLRQRSIDKFIVDFYFPELKLVLEVDGYSHDFEEKILSDKDRDTLLMGLGYKTIRVRDQEIFESINNVTRWLESELEERRIELDIERPERKSRKNKK